MSIKLVTQDKKFSPLFWTQFTGALNDNVFKNALVIMVEYKGVSLAGLSPASVVALAGGIFILPFFLFSPLAGQLADKYERSRLVRLTKLWEILIMVVASIGLYSQHFALLFVVLFLAGVQATLFGPLKYSMIPDLVSEHQLVTANAYVELGTFLAILIGTIAGGVLIASPHGEYWVMGTLLILSVLGYLTGRKVPTVPQGDAQLKIQFNPIPSFRQTLRTLKQSRAILNSVLGISWFWFFGAAILSILPVYGKEYLGVGEHVVTAFLAMFTLGIGVGSIVCERLSFHRVELGLVPIGSLGMSVFLFDLARRRPDGLGDQTNLIDLSSFLKTANGPFLLADFFFMCAFGGLFILPLYTLIQQRSQPEFRSRVIAGNNICNAMFMVAASLLVMFFHEQKLNFAQMFVTIAVSNLAVMIYIYLMVPEFTLRFLSWVMARGLYRIHVQGEAQVPTMGPAILVCNHVSYIDWLIIFASIKRPVRFVMYYKFFEIPMIRYLMIQAKVIPIAGQNEDAAIFAAAFAKMEAELRAGEVVCIFPEGEITRTGELGTFKKGIEHMLSAVRVPVVPMALSGLWGKFFAFGGAGRAFKKRPRHWLTPVALRIGQALAPQDVTAAKLKTKVKALLEP